MNDFVYQVPTKFIKEENAEMRIGTELIELGIRHILIVSSGDSFEEGLLLRIEEVLRESEINYCSLKGVKPNPHLSLVQEGIALTKREGIQFILAVGGGSVIDTAKAIAAGVYYEGDVWDFFEKKAKIQKALPTGVVLTYPATGSESSNVSVINNTLLHKKLLVSSPWLIPQFAFLNPKLTFTLPSILTARGIVDMFSHSCERYFCEEKEVGVVDRMAEAVLRTLVVSGKKCLLQPEHYDLRSEIMWIGSIAQNNLLGIGRTQDWVVHALGNELSAFYNCVHGDTLSVMMIPWMKYVYQEDRERFARYARKVFDVDASLSIEQQALAGIEETEKFFLSLSMPVRMSQLVPGIKESEIVAMVEQIPLCKDGTTGAVKKLTKEELVKIYQMA